MVELTGVEIDVSASSSTDWYIKFTEGVYSDLDFDRIIPAFKLTLDSNDYKDYNVGTAWKIMYDYLKMSPYLVQIGSTECGASGVEIGGFMIATDCKIRFLHPNNNCVVYNRIFSTDFDSDYDGTDDTHNICL